MFVAGDQLGIVVEVALQHVAAELAIRFAEQQVFVPHLVDDLGRRDDEIGGDAEEHELTVFVDGAAGEARVPAVFAGDLVREGAGGGVGVAEGGGDVVPEVRRGQVLEVVVAEAEPEFAFHRQAEEEE